MSMIPLDDERAPRRAWEWVLGVAVVIACAAWIAYRLHPSLFLRDTTTSGGDMGAHVYWPWFLERNWFLSGRLQGWSQSWYSGFPIGQYYFPFPAVLTALLDLILPYNVAFKLVTVLGPIALPIAAYVLAEQLEFPWPASPLASVATLYFQFETRHASIAGEWKTTWTIYGGNLASGLAGEYSFTLALALALFFVAAFAFTLRTGRRPWLPVVLLAACVTSHIVVAMFGIFLAVVVWLLHRPIRTIRIALPVGIIAGLLTCTWTLPLVATEPYTSSMRYGKVTEYSNWLFGPGTNFSLFGVDIPLPSPVWMWALVLAAVIGGAFWMRRCTLLLVIWAATFGALFRWWPADLAVWNTRFIPFYFLALALLCALGVAEIARLVAYVARGTLEWSSEGDRHDQIEAWRAEQGDSGIDDTWLPPHLRAPGGRELRRRRNLVMSVVCGIALVGVGLWAGYAADRQGGPLASYWAYWNYTGYEAKGEAWTEYSDLMARMGSLGRSNGCGRALWEPSAGKVDGFDDPISRYGTSLALELLPYWTNECIGSQEGLYFESSATKDTHFLTVSELAEHPSNPVRGLVYGTTADFAQGVEHARMLGVRYLMFWAPESKARAANSAALRRVLSVADVDGVAPKGWDIYEIKAWALAAGLDTEPVVARTKAGTKASCWDDPNVNDPTVKLTEWECAAGPWWMDPSVSDQPFAADGPASWRRVRLGNAGDLDGVSRRSIDPVNVSDIRQGTDTIRFRVDRIGAPVVVRTSWFPNWEAEGAVGPYRISPNLMVVVPTRRDVTLRYGLTTADWLGRLGTALGLVGLVLLLWKFRRFPQTWTYGGIPSDESPGEEGTNSAVASSGSDHARAADGERLEPVNAEVPVSLDAIFKAYDVRGIYPDEINEDIARRIGNAFARFTGAARIVVGHDMRPSSPGLAAAFTEGVVKVGVDVVQVGLCSTDVVYFASGRLDCPGAMFTASHNPAQYNGVKLCRAGAAPVGEDTGLGQIKATVAAGTTEKAEVAGTVSTLDLLGEFGAHVRSFVDTSTLHRLKVVADTANGMGGLVVPKVFEGLPFDLEILYPELDGTFPNHPADPIQVENLADLRRRVLETGADIGLAFDGDADRVFLVDDRGEPVSGSTTTAIVAKGILTRNPGETVVHNLICSKALVEVIRESGGTPVRTRVGHSFIKAVMAETGAIFGGEHSAHYYFRDNWRADSGSIAALFVLEQLCLSGKKLSELRQPFERYSQSGEINSRVSDPHATIEVVAKAYGAYPQDRLDGLTVDCGDWWFNLRPSNTEPLLRLNLEAADRPSCDAHTAEVLAIVRGE